MLETTFGLLVMIFGAYLSFEGIWDIRETRKRTNIINIIYVVIGYAIFFTGVYLVFMK